jgi:hypothetical protein
VYLDGLDQEEEIPFSLGAGDGGFEDGSTAPGQQGPTIRTGVDAGTNVIDLAAMRAELEASQGMRPKQW